MIIPATITNMIFETSILIYSLVLIFTYSLLAVIASVRMRRYARDREINDGYLILNSPLQPSVSIVASCYNESLMVRDCVGALMRLEYDNYQVIIVNDGSRDNTLELLINEYDLYKTAETVKQKLKFAEVRGVYRSHNKTWYSLVVIDKVNGGKADAMNAGIAAATGEYLINIDVDSVLLPDSLTKLMMPVLRSNDKCPVVAVGGAIGIANGCTIDNGVILSRRVPGNYLASIQVIEYARAFLLGRMGWAGMNALLLVSGALGMFRRDLVVELGGYDNTSIGEDLELIVRIRRHLYEKGIKHRIEYVPDTMLWTEVPSTLRVLYRQRIRWTKGLIGMLLANRRMLFNPHYGRLGFIAYPFWALYEWLAPFVEVCGLGYFFYMLIFGQINWFFFGFLTSFMFLFGGVLSVTAVMLDQLVVHSYNSKRDIIKLFVRGVSELLFYHPLVTYCSIVGNIQFIMGKRNNWGNMTRKGFKRN